MRKRKDAFTLIEMLVVIAVIAILAGIAFKMMQIAKRNADRASTVAKLEKLSHALNEYKAEYGTYPPAQGGVCQLHSGCAVCYQYENVNLQADWLRDNFFAEYGDSEGGNLFDMGLVSYLVERDQGAIEHKNASEWVGDTARDKAAKKRWSPFMEGVCGTFQATNKVDGTGYINMYKSVNDAWGRTVKYVTKPPYLSYELWSKGPDGQDGTADDIHKKTWDN